MPATPSVSLLRTLLLSGNETSAASADGQRSELEEETHSAGTPAILVKRQQELQQQVQGQLVEQVSKFVGRAEAEATHVHVPRNRQQQSEEPRASARLAENLAATEPPQTELEVPAAKRPKDSNVRPKRQQHQQPHEGSVQITRSGRRVTFAFNVSDLVSDEEGTPPTAIAAAMKGAIEPERHTRRLFGDEGASCD